ncbi:hypothetical protein C5C07_19135 [Haloferax sp. Atlit-4N]|uniref:hypothetical protein n=1 Tax=Haloferax sp. Atlit-4N TaxID=2077206 RepID=UPI000E22EDCD|nr:hypothetical protein [Haloferax sp. Atlit-4N]RDZ50438.1 hypothetical protein C5C07_19135 [Haloferax sp. Atlit-4N]
MLEQGFNRPGESVTVLVDRLQNRLGVDIVIDSKVNVCDDSDAGREWMEIGLTVRVGLVAERPGFFQGRVRLAGLAVEDTYEAVL